MADDEKAKKQLDELKVQRANAKGCITRVKTFVNSKIDTLTCTEAECRLGILESYWKFFLTQQSNLEKLSPDDQSHATIRGECEDLYCEIKAKLLSIMPNRSRSSVADQTFLQPGPSVSAKLPPLKLPQFSGKYSEYPNFIATFNKLVHDDPEKSTTEKYNHLLNCVCGSALQAIESLGKSAVTYSQALDKLKERFDNKFMVFQEHLTELFELPKVQKDSATQLRSLVDNMSAHLCALRALGSETDIVNGVIIYIVNSKLDSESQTRWEETIDYKKFPTWEDCEKVLSRRCQFLEGRERKTPSKDANKNQIKGAMQPLRKNSISLKVTKHNCTLCADTQHTIGSCPKFIELGINDRFEAAKKLSLCINCLRKGHTVKTCRSSKCKVCFKPHHTKLHRYSSLTEPTTNGNALQTYANTSQTPMPSKSVQNAHNLESHNNPVPSRSCLATIGPTDQVFLATAIVKMMDTNGVFHFARALLDSGSQLNFVTNRFANKLRLKRRKINADISGIGDVAAKVMYEVDSTITSRNSNYQTNMSFCILPSITGIQPEQEINTEKWNIPLNLELADPTFFKPQPIDLLIGAGMFFELMSIGQIRLQENLPILQKTLLGWIISGSYKASTIARRVCAVAAAEEAMNSDGELNAIVEKFWSMESFNSAEPKYSYEQQLCEDLFLETVRRMKDGRFMVKLPFKSPPTVLGNSYEKALRRLLSLERKLNRNPQMKEEYSKFLQEYQSLGHMELVNQDSISSLHYYLPHSCVIRPESSSTRLRVVFDASCQTSSSVSLNNILLVGPTVQNELYTVLLRFRCWKYAITADISKMYRQILVYPEDANFQYILWRDKHTHELQTFKLKTVTYGTASAPYLATRCLNHLADLNSKQFPLASKIIKQDFYVDDMLSGADTPEGVAKIQSEVQHVLLTAQLPLMKWYSNANLLLDKLTLDERAKPININGSEVIKTLGMAWDPVSDEFLYNFKPSCESINGKVQTVTKRSVLSEMSRLFDPLGLLNPIIVKAKIFLQELWLLNVHWDESLPQERQSSWIRYIEDLKNINMIPIPRFVLCSNMQYLEIHGFCDASTRAYGGCIYLRSVDRSGNIAVHLLTAKSKVAPTKNIKTLPCLELCGAELLSNLLQKTLQSLQKKISKTFLWTDSQVVLGWLGSHPSCWKPFVANRVSSIQELTSDATWRYVPTSLNPADMVSRGANVHQLLESCWFVGPQFLQQPYESWPTKKIKEDKDLPERKKTQSVMSCTAEPSFLEQVYKHDFKTTRRIFAYALRFIHKTNKSYKKDQDVATGELTPEELENSTRKIIWAIQQQSFREDIRSLRQAKQVSKSSSVSSLNPFLDNSELLRVGGRLKNADIPYEAKYPILLPKENAFVRSYVEYLHVKNFHAGPQTLVALLRQKYWIINARDYTRKVVRKCTYCFRYRPRLCDQIMGDLPELRLCASQAFENVGIDFCGPIMVTHKIRGRRPYKSYIAVFVCFLTKGVHLEVVTDLSSEAFIAALKRFSSRRRLCKYLHCDNATNFVGARGLLAELRDKWFSQQTQTEISRWCAEESITFNHIPPRSPHFGGLWEAAVRSSKGHLYRTLRNSLLTFEELTTVCCQIEAILNSRPLCELSSDPSDEEALTPAHFWNQAPLTCILEPDFQNQRGVLVSRWRQISLLQQHFWKRWTTEYLASLHQRYKWKFSPPNILVNSLVLISDSNLPPQKWLLGRVVGVINGQDGKVRVADVRTKAGIFRRAVHKLAPLPTARED